MSVENNHRTNIDIYTMDTQQKKSVAVADATQAIIPNFSKDYTPHDHIFRDKHFRQLHHETITGLNTLSIALVQLEELDQHANAGERITVTDMCEIVRLRFAEMENRMEELLHLFRPVVLTDAERLRIESVSAAQRTD